ncbi:MAG: toxin-antitoxin system YwqK family antitoxin [Saprospiraceae bacterium]
MKIALILALLFPLLLSGQSDIDTTNQRMVPMSQTYQKAYRIGNKYYEVGTTKPFTGILYGRYDNGQLQTLQEFKNGVGDGTWINYDPEGRKEIQGTYVDNRIEGPVTLFYENGQVKAKGQYRHWKQSIGWWTYYDLSGKVVQRMLYTP